MKFSTYLESTDNAEQQKRLQEKIIDLKEHLEKGAKIPVLGKYVSDLMAYAECESIEDFKKSDHFDRLKDWEIETQELEDGDFGFSFTPGKEQMAKASKIVGMVVGGLILLCLLKKICGKSKK